MSIPFSEIQSNWKESWEEEKLYHVSHESDKPKYYVLDMFPYPSGAGLHVGHPLGYIASDIYSRYKRMKGFNVLHPIGFDSFGLPAEEYALQTGIHPAISTRDNIERYKEQLSNLGISFDWSRQISTSAPDYYRWTQWIFSLLFNHYYDNTLDKAMPIEHLVEKFAKDGSHSVDAATDNETPFDAETWHAMSEVEKNNKLMNYRLAYQDTGFVNYCEALGTVLANDQVKDGFSERGGHPVEQRAMTQWYLRITAYAQRLLDDLDTVDWSDSLKTIQRNWIGRSEGALVNFDVKGHDVKIDVFTTRPDTIYGATYLVLAPEHDAVKQLTTPEQQSAVEDYLNYVKSKSELDRMADKQVTGVFLGSYAHNPFTNEDIPIWIGEYVLKSYGTGAIMAVPSDDERDMTFAKKFGLKIVDVVDKSKYPGATLSDKVGVLINSGEFNGLEVQEAITAVSQKIEEMGIGKRKINFRLRDANFSRQRYWGEPFPIVYNKEGVAETLSKEQLPVILPDTDDFKPGKAGKSPLSRITEWSRTPDGMIRETDVMPAVAGSSWYFLRYMDPNNPNEFASSKALEYWQDVDLYIGGSEHAVAHLMYARFWHKFLYDKGLVPTKEPFKRLVNQGMIQGVIEYLALAKAKEDGHSIFISADLLQNMPEDSYIKIPVFIDFVEEYGSEQSYMNSEGLKQFVDWRKEYQNAKFRTSTGLYSVSDLDKTNIKIETVSEVGKMSKSKYNVINPDEVIDKYGADVFRMYEMFLGPIQQSKPWDTKGIDGVYKFIYKYWSLIFDENNKLIVTDEKPTKAELKALHTAIKKVDYDIQNLSFNTSVSAFMICVNELKKLKCHKRAIIEPLTILLAPFAPFITEEVWHRLGHTDSVHIQDFPEYKEEYLVEDSIEYPICFNGKKKTTMVFPNGLSKSDIEKEVLESGVLEKYAADKNVKKVIIVPGKMVNLVV